MKDSSSPTPALYSSQPVGPEDPGQLTMPPPPGWLQQLWPRYWSLTGARRSLAERTLKVVPSSGPILLCCLTQQNVSICSAPPQATMLAMMNYPQSL